MHQLKTTYLQKKKKSILADTITPVAIYLRLRDIYSNPLLLESTDYHSQENHRSYICFEPIATFSALKERVSYSLPNQSEKEIDLPQNQVLPFWDKFMNSFQSNEKDSDGIGFFGHCFYNSVEYFEHINFNPQKKNVLPDTKIPTLRYNLYRYTVIIDHHKDLLTIIELFWNDDQKSNMEEVLSVINSKNIPQYNFKKNGGENANMTDEKYLEIVKKSIAHCHKGNVFQIVPSRNFSIPFLGDEFNVYRALRSINPSPYLFYFDYGDYKLFGSSPEAHLVIKDGKAEIHPIAGTFKRTGDDEADFESARLLFSDEKENSEHIMLVDLARNDLSKYCRNVKLEVFKEIQFYSHVIHLVSKVTGLLKEDVKPLQLLAATFPAGTLSGAPKYKAMEIIDKLEEAQRSFYGGAVGFIELNKNFNHAIVIRSFLSSKNILQYQAGAGVVAKSVPEKELQEVSNKLRALRIALEKAEEWN